VTLGGSLSTDPQTRQRGRKACCAPYLYACLPGADRRSSSPTSFVPSVEVRVLGSEARNRNRVRDLSQASLLLTRTNTPPFKGRVHRLRITKGHNCLDQPGQESFTPHQNLPRWQGPGADVLPLLTGAARTLETWLRQN